MSAFGASDACPYDFNFDPDTFKAGDTVSYRVPQLGEFPFVATIVAVYADYLEIADVGDMARSVRATRESRPVVSNDAALGGP